jgi:hypothetical protein
MKQEWGQEGYAGLAECQAGVDHCGVFLGSAEQRGDGLGATMCVLCRERLSVEWRLLSGFPDDRVPNAN